MAAILCEPQSVKNHTLDYFHNGGSVPMGNNG